MMLNWLRFFCFVLLLLGHSAGDSFAEAVPEQVAKVGNISINKYELRREMQHILPLNTSYHKGISAEKIIEVQEKALNNLIDQAYKIQYALSQEISVPNSAVEERFGKVLAKFGSEEALQQQLGEEKISSFRAAIYRMLLAKKAEEIAVYEKIRTTDEELQQFYDEKKDMYQQPKRYRVSQILIKVDPSLVGEERAKLVQKADELAGRALEGEDFYNLAYYNSDDDTKYVGGDMGYFFSGKASKEIENAVKDLSPGDITGPVETLVGFHIIKLTEVEDARQLPYEEVKLQIKKRIEENRYEILYQEWLGELKKQYTVEVFYKQP